MTTKRVNVLMNKGPSIVRKRGRRGYGALTPTERKIYDEYTALKAEVNNRKASFL